MGTPPTTPLRSTVDRTQLLKLAADADRVLAMLKRANVLLAGAAINTCNDDVRAVVVKFIKESTTLVRRIEAGAKR